MGDLQKSQMGSQRELLAPVTFVLQPGPWGIRDNDFRMNEVPARYRGLRSMDDPQEIRDLLWKVTDKQSCADFLNRAGYVVICNDSVVHPLDPGHVSAALLSGIMEWRSACEGLLSAKPSALKEWGTDKRYNGTVRHYAYHGTGVFPSLPVGFSWDERGFPELRVIARTGLEAAVILCHLDRVKRLNFKKCQRPDCPVIYEVETAHPRRFCSPECRHLEVVRRGRRKAKKAARRSKGGGRR